MKYIRVIIITFFLFPLISLADENRVLVECPKAVKTNQEIECLITGYSSFSISGLELEISLPDTVEKISSTVDKGWQGTEENNLFLLYTDEFKKDTFPIGTITIKPKENLESLDIKVVYLSYGDEYFQKKEILSLKDVKQTETKKEKEQRPKNNYFKYVIIILIIGLIVVGAIIVKKLRSGKNEK